MAEHTSSLTAAPRVCVIGAGFAGLRCAEVLTEHGFAVTLLEGRDRVGGRVHQQSLGGSLVDLGANWIHGTQDNPILEFAQQTSTAVHDVGEASISYDEHGNRLPSETTQLISAFFWGAVADAYQYCRDKGDSIPVMETLKDFIRRKLEESDLDSSQRTLVLQLAEMWGAFIGETLDRQSLKYFFLEETLAGENLFIAGTMQKILHAVAKTALEKTDLRLSCCVQSISTIDPASGSGRAHVEVQTDAGIETYDAVVLTASLGCLKHSQPKISPNFPLRLQEAIQNLSYGRLEKVYLHFPRAFWREASTDEPSDTFLTSFLHPQYASQGNANGYNVQVCSMASLPAPYAHSTLLFYIAGPLGTDCVNAVKTLQPGTPAHLAALARFFEPYYSRLPGYKRQDDNCKPDTAVATAWQNDELAGHGSYTCFLTPSRTPDSGSPGPQLDRDIEILREGLPDRGLWLAGEHTAPFVATGTTTGAWWSGDAVAKRIIKRFAAHLSP